MSTSSQWSPAAVALPSPPGPDPRSIVTTPVAQLTPAPCRGAVSGRVLDASAPVPGVCLPRPLGPQNVYLLIETAFQGRAVTRWYRDTAGFAHARALPVPSSGTRTVNIPIG